MLLVVVAVLFGAGLPILVLKGIGWKPIEPQLQPVTAVAPPAPPKEPAAPPPPITAQVPDTTPPLPLTVKGYAWRGRVVRVVLSDGRTLTERDKELSGPHVRIDSAGVTLGDGTRLWMTRPTPQKGMMEVRESAGGSRGETSPLANFATTVPERLTVPEEPTVRQPDPHPIPVRRMGGVPVQRVVPRGTSPPR